MGMGNMRSKLFQTTKAKFSFRLFKKAQMRGARRAMSGSVLMYVDAKSLKRNEADEPFSTA
jgi:hypothetical protein